MKKNILLFILLVAPFFGYSQLSIGLAGGYTSNTLIADEGYYERDYSSRGGYSISIPVQYSFNNWLAVRGELGYMTKNYRWDREEYEYEYEKRRNGFLSVPVMANFSYGGERLKGFINVGGWLGAWLEGKVSNCIGGAYNYESNYVSGKYEFDSRRDNRFDAGLLCGIGAEYKINSLIGIFAEGRYMYGLTDMQKSYTDSYPRYNSTVLVQLGVTYSFNLK